MLLQQATRNSDDILNTLKDILFERLVQIFKTFQNVDALQYFLVH